MRDAIGIAGLIAWFLLGAVNIAVITGALALPTPVTIALVIAQLGALAAAGWYLLPLMAYGGRRPDPARVAEVRRSRALAGTIRTSGRIGGVSVGFPLLAVTVHEAGIILQPLLLTPCAILRGEITAVQAGRTVKVEHTSSEVESPVVIRKVFGDDLLARLLATF
ncbi:MAG TPA: hypothetical protein VM733_02550 [Thermoanaerobaculia bacterium]|nr:hypothetical protein [Thermoanaerobaculia bacterium]